MCDMTCSLTHHGSLMCCDCQTARTCRSRCSPRCCVFLTPGRSSGFGSGRTPESGQISGRTDPLLQLRVLLMKILREKQSMMALCATLLDRLYVPPEE